MFSLQSVCKGLQVIGSTKGSSFTFSFDNHLLHCLHKEYVTFVFQKHPCFFAVFCLVSKDPESVVSGVEGNVRIVGEICFKSAWHICSMAQYNCFFLHSGRHVGSMDFID